MIKKNTGYRDYAISYVRLIAMLMIIVCHFFQFYGNELAFWFNVGVQVFFVISGFLYGAKDIDEPIDFICRQFKKILVPYYTFLIPVSVLFFIFARSEFSITAFIKSVFCVGTMDGLGHLWFIGYILFCYLITPYLYQLRKKVEEYSLVKMTAVYIVILLGFVIIGTLTDFYFQPNMICCYIVGFIIASYKNKYGNVALKISAILFIVSAVILNAIRVYVKYFYELSKESIIYKLFSFAEPYIHLLLGVALFFILYYIFKKAGECTLLLWSDKFSFPIYIVHQTFILSAFSTMALTPYFLMNWLLTVLLIIVSGVVLYYVSNCVVKKINNRS